MQVFEFVNSGLFPFTILIKRLILISAKDL